MSRNDCLRPPAFRERPTESPDNCKRSQLVSLHLNRERVRVLLKLNLSLANAPEILDLHCCNLHSKSLCFFGVPEQQHQGHRHL